MPFGKLIQELGGAEVNIVGAEARYLGSLLTIALLEGHQSCRVPKFHQTL
jgi:hypothetical protein